MARSKSKQEVPVIPVEQLVLDDANPRFADPLSQKEILSNLAADEKTANLARHIAQHGLDPTSIPGAVLLDGRLTRYVVREGNRRLAALKLLNNPALAGTNALAKKFRKIAETAVMPIPSSMPCVIFEGDDGDEWIALKHSGPQNGEGTVPWDAMQRTRFNVRTGRSDPNRSAQRLLDHAAEKKWLAKDQVDSIGITNLTRLLNDPDVQAVWGISVTDDTFSFGIGSEAMKPFMQRMLTDWRKRKGDMRVANIYEKDDRIRYARQVVKDLGEKVRSDATIIDRPSPARTASKSATRKIKPSSLDRSTLIPRGFHLNIEVDRAHEIYLELRTMDIKYRNSISMAFRAFVEWSATFYCKSAKITLYEDMSLPDKISKALSDMKGKGLDRAVVEAVEMVVAKRNSVFTIKTFHQYVHNVHSHPAPTDLKAYWDTLAPFLRACWEGVP